MKTGRITISRDLILAFTLVAFVMGALSLFLFVKVERHYGLISGIALLIALEIITGGVVAILTKAMDDTQ